MEYKPQRFVDGQLLTANCLNKIEEGIAAAFGAIPPACDNADCSKVLSYGENGFEWVSLPNSEIPVFDFTSKGMDTIDVSGSSAQWSGDTTELFNALNKGAVTFVLPIAMDGATMSARCTMHSFTDGENMHQCVGLFYSETDMIYIIVNVMIGAVQVLAAPMSYAVQLVIENMFNKTPAEVDLTAFESSGTIVETYRDGSEITYTMERNADGKPTKITDSNGNVTVLTW